MTMFARAIDEDVVGLISAGGWVGGGCGVTIDGEFRHAVSARTFEDRTLVRLADGTELDVTGQRVELVK